MSLVAQVPLQTILAAAGQTVFPFNFRCDDAALLIVYVNNNQQGGFGVALNADQVAAPGGTVTLAPAALNDAVEISRVSPQSQTVALTRYGPFPADVITAGLDKIVMLIQELTVRFVRFVTISRAVFQMLSTTDLPAPVAGATLVWVQVGAKFQLSSVLLTAQIPAPFTVLGELLTDSGDHVNFTSAFAPTAARALYRNGQRIFSPGDFAVAGNVWTMTTPINPALGEVLNADYAHA